MSPSNHFGGIPNGHSRANGTSTNGTTMQATSNGAHTRETPETSSLRIDTMSKPTPSGEAGTVITKYGYYLDLDLAQFGASMFGMSNAELSTLDPGQRLLLEVTREAFESAGEANFRGRNIGTFVGDFTEDWQDLQNVDLLNHQPYLMVGKSDFALANRLAFEYDLLGPSVSIKTACSAG
ncbi:hypothetical protein EYZ11_008724 [Aspergillus tanneri]|uniref:Ketosynthase family 3 (KS3) domain-containing protein n=1 Tax=Aspergillus tanneri TaxID=1220188 RepID=A0A4S3J9Q6_9EURO|nr:hypothetical protein EYZ11_008724 [Aspergillus tanneri]